MVQVLCQYELVVYTSLMCKTILAAHSMSLTQLSQLFRDPALRLGGAKPVIHPFNSEPHILFPISKLHKVANPISSGRNGVSGPSTCWDVEQVSLPNPCRLLGCGLLGCGLLGCGLLGCWLLGCWHLGCRLLAAIPPVRWKSCVCRSWVCGSCMCGSCVCRSCVCGSCVRGS